MILTIKLFGLLMILLCAWGMVKPRALSKWVLDVWKRSWAIYFAVALRIALGILFLMAAGQTRFPEVFNFLGYLMIFAAVAIAVIGRERLDKFMQWFEKLHPMAIRAWLLLGLLFGVFVVYAVS